MFSNSHLLAGFSGVTAYLWAMAYADSVVGDPERQNVMTLARQENCRVSVCLAAPPANLADY
jgi:hypothetical protein